jgi:large subunit ribosomal protein L10
MPKTRAQKSEAVTELVQAFKGAKAAAFADYQGMTVSKLSDLRKKLRGQKVEYLVAKKTLLSRAAKEAGYEVDFKAFPGMIGAAFAMEDEMAAAKIIGDAGKDAPIKLVGGLFEGKVVDQAYVTALAKLPSKQDLLGQVLRVMNGPASALVRLLNARKEKLEAAPAA